MTDHAAAQAAIDRAGSIPLDAIDVSHPDLWATNSHWPYFERLRREDPVHFCRDSQFGPYWSITKYNDIMAVDTNHKAFSSGINPGGITIDEVIEVVGEPGNNASPFAKGYTDLSARIPA